MKKEIALLGVLCAAGLGAGSTLAAGTPTYPQLSLNDQRLACPQAVWGCDARDLAITGDLRTALWTVVEGDTGPYLAPVRDKAPGPQVTTVMAQIPYAVPGDTAHSRRGGQLEPLDAPPSGGAAVRGQDEQPQGLPRAVFAALIALIGIVAVARRGMSRKD